MGRHLLTAILCTGLLAAQTPPPSPVTDDAPLDLEALAKQLDPGELPSVVEVIPAPVFARLRKSGSYLSSAEVDVLLDMRVLHSGDDIAPMLAAFAVAGGVSDEPPTPAATLREIEACLFLWGVSAWPDWLRDMISGDHEWLAAARRPARTRANALAARLMRDHPDDLAVTRVLQLFRDSLEGVSANRVHAEVLRRLGRDARPLDYLLAAAAALQAGELEHTESLLQRARLAPPAPSLREGSYAAQIAFEMRTSLAEIRGQLPLLGRPGLEGRIAQLRVMLVENAAAAIRESRTLVDADVQHALPFSLLAYQDAYAGRRKEAMELLARAEGLPGHDIHTAAAMVWSQLMPVLGRPDGSAQAQGEAMAAFPSALAAIDEQLGGDLSAQATIFSWMRDELGWPAMSIEALRTCLPAAVTLQQGLPDSLSAYMILLVAATLSDDEAAAHAALLRPIPRALADLQEVALRRAELLVRRALFADRMPADEVLDAVFGDLERVQADPHDAKFLRGVLCWWQATRPGAPVDLMRTARDLFAAAQRGPAEAGWWRVAWALAVVRAELGEDVNLDDLVARAGLRSGGDQGASMLSLAAMLDGSSPELVQFVQREAASIVHPPTTAVVQAALAVGHHVRGDQDATRRAAKAALQAISTMTSRDLPHDRGIVCAGSFSLALENHAGRPTFRAVLGCDLWVVPRVPGLDRLKILAAEK